MMLKNFAVVVALLFGAVALVADDPKEQSLRDFVLATKTKQGYGIYFGDQKVGWGIDEMKLGERDGKEVAVSSSEMMLQMEVDGVEHVMKSNSVTIYSLEGDGPIIYSKDRTEDEGVLHEHEATAEKDKMLIKSRIGERKSSRRVPMSRDTLGHAQNVFAWMSAEREPGDTIDDYSLVLDDDDTDQSSTITFKGRKTIQRAGVKEEVFQVSVDENGLIMELTVLADMRPVSGKMGPFEVRAEDLAAVKELGEVAVTSFSTLPVKKQMGDPMKVDRLKIELLGAGDFQVPTTHRQKVLSRDDESIVLEVFRDQRPEDPQPLTDEERAEYLKATPSLQVDSKKIQKIAKRVLRLEEDPIQVADLLQKWVFKKLDKRLDTNASTALHVLDQESGDCTEHTMLFVALARAAGIPAREVGGLAYGDFGDPSFGWHAWAQIHDGHAWISVDPTWDAVYVDGTHILLQSDGDDFAWANLLGSVKLKIIDFDSKKRPKQDDDQSN